MSEMKLIPGLEGEIETVVTEADLAVALGSGDVAVLGTPRAVALAEAATVRAIAGALDPGMTSVGTRVDLRHLAATLPGHGVRAVAKLAEVKGKALTFKVKVFDVGGLVAEGTVERFVVNRERFIERAGPPRA